MINEQGDTFVQIQDLKLVERTLKTDQVKEAWIAVRTIFNETVLEQHSGPHTHNIYYQCVVEECKVRMKPEFETKESGYLLFGDVVEAISSIVTPEGLVFIQLHPRYFYKAVWVLERTLENMSVLNEIEGPSSVVKCYQCVQRDGAPVRSEPELSSAPIGRLPCGSVVKIASRILTQDRHIFVQFHANEKEFANAWVIVNRTDCATVMMPVEMKSPETKQIKTILSSLTKLMQ